MVSDTITTPSVALLDEVRAAVTGVPDPELPPVTLGMLGMIHDIAVDDGVATIELLPTFSGCPATEMMTRDVTAAVLEVEGIDAVDVRWRYAPAWTPDRINEEGHDRLREFGIAPPGGEVPSPRPTAGRRTLPVMAGGPAAPAAPRPCPYCGSTDTVQDAPFGPTPCRDVRFCNACTQPFEAFKDL